MAGNELKIVEYLLKNKNTLELKHLKDVKEIGAPQNDTEYVPINSIEELRLISTEDAGKKADIYINGYGVSLKQKGSSFAFNRMQRAGLIKIFENVGISNPANRLSKLDKAVDEFHQGLIKKRSLPWTLIFSTDEFKSLLKYLMCFGSPYKGYTKNPAKFILEAPKEITNNDQISVYDFDEYFERYKSSMSLAMRRQWIGQSSESEHNRAFSMSQKVENLVWVYDNVVGSPRINKRTGLKWRPEVPENERKTVYFISIEKNNK